MYFADTFRFTKLCMQAITPVLCQTLIQKKKKVNLYSCALEEISLVIQNLCTALWKLLELIFGGPGMAIIIHLLYNDFNCHSGDISTNSVITLCQTIKQGDWLTDRCIDAASRVLKRQFPDTPGLNSCLLGQNLSYPVSRDFFIQILFVNGNHWITVAGVPPSSVDVYDSKYAYLSQDSKMQIASILRTSEPSVSVRMQSVQHQKGDSECGLYAIAYATDLAFGNDPASYIYKQSELRAHLVNCLKRDHMTPFITKPKKPLLRKIGIHCTCRLPDNGAERMIKCGQCSTWFHQSCENVSKSMFTFNCVWKCSKCN